MKSVLITGGTGFFGKSILDYFSRHACPYEFTFLSRHGFSPSFLSTLPTPTSQTSQTPQTSSLNSCNSCNSWLKSTPSPHLSNPSNPSNLSNHPTQLLGDIRTFSLPPSTHFDYIIHAATPARADIPDDEMRSIIIDGTANALRQAKKCGATKFMMVSSGGVYGKGFTRPISESDDPHPYTAYGKAKLEAEQMAIDSGLYTLIPRCFAFVGRYLDRNAHFAIGNFIRDALAGKDIVINGDGSPMRSYMYADDLVEWLFAILERGTSGRPYNVGSPHAISIRDLATLVLATLTSQTHQTSQTSFPSQTSQTSQTSPTRPTVRILGSPVPGAANYYVPDIKRAQTELSLSCKFDLCASIISSIAS